jgi:uncharacterized protein Yka (UPF0111/DUF47 family)
MTFWEKIQKDVKKNIQEGIAALREGSTTVSKKIELLTEEGKRRYKIHTLHMKVKEEFERLGGQLYDLVTKKSKDPLSNRRVTSIISKIKKLEGQITRLERKGSKKTVKKASK